RRSRLSPAEVRTAERLAVDASSESLKELQAVAPGRRALVLDSAYDLFRYRAGFRRDQTAAVQIQDQRLLQARNDIPASAAAIDSTTEHLADRWVSPDHGHRTGRLGLSYGFTDHSHFEELEVRPAAHDQDDAPLGYIPGSQLQMFHLRLRYDNDRKTGYLEQFSLVDLKTYSAWDRWIHHPAWEVGTGAEVAHDLAKDPENSLTYDTHGGSGIAFHTPLSKDSMIYALGQADFAVGAPFRDDYRLGGGGSAGLWFDLFRFWRVHVNAMYLKYLLGDPMGSVRLSCINAVPLGPRGQLRVQLERQNSYKEILLSFLSYW
ncbi:MAG TPA: hypothetical protein VMU17_03580, partial [Elusimicrobiota bacterium]|nr:hypothetical protein [Elusimicrobiota bacterium]